MVHEPGPSRPATILYVLSSASLGGANRSMWALLSGLDRLRYRPLVVAPSPGPLLERLATRSIPTTVMPLPSLARLRASSVGRLKAAVRNARNLVRLMALIRREGVDLVHTSTIFPLGGALAAALTGRPHIWHLREGLDTPQYDLRFGRAATRALIGLLGTRLICISEYVLSVSVSTGARSRAEVVYNALETIPAPVSSAGDAPLVATVGLLGEKKRTLLFVDAAIRIARAVPESRFLVAGRATAGEEAVVAACRQRVAAAGLADRFSWPGFVESEQQLWAGVRLLIHPGVHEAFGRVLMEAMSRGIPVVAVRSGAVPELIRDGHTGLIVPPDDADAMAGAVTSLLRDAARHEAMARRAREEALARFAPGRHVARVCAIYDALRL